MIFYVVELLDEWNVDVPSWKYPRNLESPRVSSPGFGNDSKMMGESMPEPDEIDNVIEDIVDLVRQINLEVDRDDVQELLDSHSQELTKDEHIEMHGHSKKLSH
ncbi:hypothetical protein TNCV_2342761 [Trichonephila clavipes]|nr:hypothetical protein TNCV_2342761 [Trichonephila clavipes]